MEEFQWVPAWVDQAQSAPPPPPTDQNLIINPAPRLSTTPNLEVQSIIREKWEDTHLRHLHQQKFVLTTPQ